MADLPRDSLNVSMFAPWHARCGIRDYTAHLIDALDDRPEIASTRVVPAPVDAVRPGTGAALAHYLQDARRYRDLGRAMNAGADIAHIQHQYFIFGGVAPYKTHVTAFIDALQVPAVMTVHEIAAAPPPGLLPGLAVGVANHLNFDRRELKALIVHTEADRQRLIEMGIPEARVHLVRHGVPPALATPDPAAARTALEREYPEIKGRRVVTLFGFLSIKKGHPVALSALMFLPDDVALIFAGGQHPDDHTDYVSSVKTVISYMQPKRTVITGYLPEERVPEIMAVTDVALAPFLQSSGSGSLAALLAYGRAVVASDIPPHRELTAEEPGLLRLFPTGNFEDMANEVMAVLNNPADRESLQQAALTYAARFTYGRMARETVQVYQSVLSSAR